MHQLALTQTLGIRNFVALIVITTLNGMLGKPLHKAAPKAVFWVSPPTKESIREHINQCKELIHLVNTDKL
jgi:UDP-N-acetylglucosamine pyrophosphorylase